MKRFALIVCVALFALPAYAADMPGSLFFTTDEAKAIAAIIAKDSQGGNPAMLRLDALFYYGPEDWVFWLGGTRWEPGSQKPNFHVVSVAPDEVRLQWTADAEGQGREIVLKPHQAFQTATGMVVEP
jgi:hypothetical protein